MEGKDVGDCITCSYKDPELTDALLDLIIDHTHNPSTCSGCKVHLLVYEQDYEAVKLMPSPHPLDAHKPPEGKSYFFWINEECPECFQWMVKQRHHVAKLKSRLAEKLWICKINAQAWTPQDLESMEGLVCTDCGCNETLGSKCARCGKKFNKRKSDRENISHI